MEEEPSIADSGGHALETFLFSSSLNFEDSDASDLCSMSFFVLSSAEAVSSNQIALGITLLEELNLYTQAIVDVLNWVNRVLAVDGCQEQTTCEFNVHQIVDLRDLLLHLVNRLHGPNNFLIIDFLWNELVELAREIAELDVNCHHIIILSSHA